MSLTRGCLHRVVAGEGAVVAGITAVEPGGAECLTGPGNQPRCQGALKKVPKPCTLHGTELWRCWQHCRGSRAGPGVGHVQETGEGHNTSARKGPTDTGCLPIVMTKAELVRQGPR